MTCWSLHPSIHAFFQLSIIFWYNLRSFLLQSFFSMKANVLSSDIQTFALRFWILPPFALSLTTLCRPFHQLNIFLFKEFWRFFLLMLTVMNILALTPPIDGFLGTFLRPLDCLPSCWIWTCPPCKPMFERTNSIVFIPFNDSFFGFKV